MTRTGAQDQVLTGELLARLSADKNQDPEREMLVLAALEGQEALDAYLDGTAAPKRPEAPAGTEAAKGTATSPSPQRTRRRLPQEHHGRRLPRHRPQEDPRPPARPRPHPGRRPQRLRQEQLRRGPRAAPHRRHLPLEEAPRRRLARRLAQPPPREGRPRGRVLRRGRQAHQGRLAVEGRRRPRRRRDLRPGPRQEADEHPGPRLDPRPQDLPAHPLVQRARLHARPGPLEALRRALRHPRPRRADRGPGDPGRSPEDPRHGPQGSGGDARPGSSPASARSTTSAPAPSSPRWQNKKDWSLSAVEAVLDQAGAGATQESDLQALRQLASLHAPTQDATTAVVRDLRDADARQRATAGTLAAKSRDLAAILDRTLAFHKAHGDGDCPVCGKKGALDAAWHQHHAQEAERLRDAAREAQAAHDAAESARKKALALTAPTPETLAKAKDVGLDPTAATSSARHLARRPSAGSRARSPRPTHRGGRPTPRSRNRRPPREGRRRAAAKGRPLEAPRPGAPRLATHGAARPRRALSPSSP